MNCNLEIRFREPGDYLVVDDSGHRQKLKSFFINQKFRRNKGPVFYWSRQVKRSCGSRDTGEGTATG